MAWSISPNDLATIDSGSGLATFQEHTETIIYTVTYTDGDCTKSKTITVRACPDQCDCENITIGPAPAAWAATSLEQKTISVSDPDGCLDGVSLSTPTYFNASYSNNVITVYPKAQNKDCSAHTDTLTISFTSGTKSCSVDRELRHEPTACTCTMLTASPSSLVFQSNDDSSNPQDITISTASTCINNVRTGGTLNYFNASYSNNKVTVTPKNKNTSKSAYTDTLLISYSACSTPCSSSITLTQNALNCDCGLVQYQQVSTEKGILDIFEKSGQTDVKIGTVTINGECTSDSVEFKSNNPGVVTNIRITGVTNGVGDVIADLPYVENPCKGTYNYYVGGQLCDKAYDIRRMCYCGTDNCTQPGVYEHPLHMEYCNAWCQNGSIVYKKPTSGSYVKIGSLDTGDHFFVDHGELLYNGNPPANGDILTPDVGADWCWGTYVYPGSGCPRINYECLENTGPTRTATFTFTTPPNTRLKSNCLSTPWSGRSCCETFIVEVIQSAVGNGWEKIYPVEGDSYYVEVPLTSLCTSTKCSGGNTLGLGDGSCVSSAATSNKVELGTWTKTPAGCTDSWSYDGSRTISGSNFINASSLEFRSDGKIYGKVSVTNSTTSTRTCQIPTKLGSVKDYFTVVQCAGGSTPPPTPTTYTYTINSTNDNANGASVVFTSNGTTITTSTISDRTCTVTLSNHYSNLNATITKSGCDSVSTTVSANNSATITMTCETPVQCQVSLDLISAAPAAGGTMYIGEWHTTGSCTNPTTLTYVSGAGNFLSSIDVRSNNGIYANVAQNTNTSPRTSKYRITYGTATAEANITQLGATPPTTYTYTINSTDDNANGAYAIFVNEGSIVTQIAIANRTCTFTSSTYYPVLYVAVSKTGYKTVNTTVNANSSTNITMTSCASETYDTSSIVTQYLDISQNDSLEISYPSVGECWTPSIYYLAGGSSVKSEVFGDRKVTLKFKDNIEIACYLLFTNKGDSSNRVATGTIHITFND